MCDQNLELIENFLRQIESADPSLDSLPLLSEDVIYDLYIAQERPVNCSILGRGNIQTYLSLLPKTYETLKINWRDIFAAGDRVIVAGCECAWVARLQQVVDTEWTCVFQFQGALIQRISMSIYRWRIRPADEWPEVPGLSPSDKSPRQGHLVSRSAERLVVSHLEPTFRPSCSGCLDEPPDENGAESAAGR
jgi:hypothetical protein